MEGADLGCRANVAVRAKTGPKLESGQPEPRHALAGPMNYVTGGEESFGPLRYFRHPHESHLAHLVGRPHFDNQTWRLLAPLS